MLLHMGQREESEAEAGEAGGEAGGELGERLGERLKSLKAHHVLQEQKETKRMWCKQAPQSVRKGALGMTRYDQHTEYQEMLRTQQAMLQTFNNMLGILQQFVNGHQ